MRGRSHKTSAAALACAGILLAGCATAPPQQPRAAVRQSIISAPADLQLVCAAQTVRRLDLKKTDILPVDSRLLVRGVFEVDLKFKGGTAQCVIDDRGRIMKVVRT